ncbi:inter-alpha-trypsin inhibitor heavy chain H3-like isoform X2 [Hetaerina americana]|uniref:inter-alpha-trypsin inhibitor heavy chain H3-like isoform X2 n=1 Tax=Hetaerina americana TaxID=62018 RepID=UPI003A7F3601
MLPFVAAGRWVPGLTMTATVSGASRLRGLVWSVTTSLVLMTAPGVMTFSQGVAPESPQKPETILQSYIVNSNIHYRYASTLVSSQVVNPTEQKQRVNFTVILPEDAYITSFVMDVGDQLYETTVAEREKLDVDGKLDEIEAVRVRDSNVFRASVCLAPGGTRASFYLTYEELLQRRMGAYQHVINLHPGQVAQEMKVEVVIHEGRNISALTVPSIRSGHEIDTEPHERDNLIQVLRPSPKEAHIKLTPTPEEQRTWKGQWKRTKSQKERIAQRGRRFIERGIEGQLVVLYDVAREPYTSSKSGGEVVVQDGYFVHFFSPANLPRFNRHLIFVIDVSESMKGRKWKHLKTALIDILNGLQKTEYFSIIKFNNKKSVWSPFPKKTRINEPGRGRVLPATPKYLERAKKHLKKLSLKGGTKTLQGLLRGLSLARETQKFGGNATIFPMIVLITDGESNMDNDATASEETNQSDGSLDGDWEIPIFSLGYEPDSDMPFLRAISRRSAGGFARRIYDAADSDLQISELHAESAFPVLGGIRFTYSNRVGDLEVDPATLTYTRFYTAMSGSELVVAGKLKGHFESSMETKYDPNLDIEKIDGLDSGPSLRGAVTAISALGRAILPFRSSVSDSSFRLDRLWAYLMVSQLTSREAAQKVWGSLWVERSRNGVNASSSKATDITRWTDGIYHAELATNVSYLVSSSKIMAKHYSFVSPGMILKFAEMKDDPWDYIDQRVMDYDSIDSNPGWGGRKHGRGRRHSRKPRPHKGSLRGDVALGRMRLEEYDRGWSGEQCDMKEGIYWLTLPLVPRPSSVCQVGIHNLTCPEGLPERQDRHEKYPFVKSLADLAWMKDVKRGANLVLPKGYHGADNTFKLGLGQDDKLFGKCKTPAGVPGHCRHLNYCLLKDFAADYNHFLKYFCHIEGSPNYVGVCCPDYLYKNRIHHG